MRVDDFDKVIYIRVDMNDIIATGHMMRCISIAEAARDININAVFIIAEGSAVSMIQSRGFEYIVLNSRWNDLEYELLDLISLIKQRNVTRLLIDSYYVTERYLKELYDVTETIYIDDINMFDYKVDRLICYADYYKDFKYDKTHYCSRLHYLGTKFVPLRKEFSSNIKKKISDKIECVLLLSGGTDNKSILSNILNVILGELECKVYVVCGRYSCDYYKMKEQYRKYEQVFILKNVNNINEYMQEADLAISAGGTTLYELCVCGVPSISYSMADNQIRGAERLGEEGIISYIGDIRYNDITTNLKYCIKRYYDRSYRERLSIKMQNKVDGKGANRIVEALVNSLD